MTPDSPTLQSKIAVAMASVNGPDATFGDFACMAMKVVAAHLEDIRGELPDSRVHDASVLHWLGVDLAKASSDCEVEYLPTELSNEMQGQRLMYAKGQRAALRLLIGDARWRSAPETTVAEHIDSTNFLIEQLTPDGEA